MIPIFAMALSTGYWDFHRLHPHNWCMLNMKRATGLIKTKIKTTLVIDRITHSDLGLLCIDIPFSLNFWAQVTVSNNNSTLIDLIHIFLWILKGKNKRLTGETIEGTQKVRTLTPPRVPSNMTLFRRSLSSQGTEL